VVAKGIIDNAGVVNRTADYLTLKFNVNEKRSWPREEVQAFDLYGDEIIREALYDLWICVAEGRELDVQYWKGFEIGRHHSDNKCVDWLLCGVMTLPDSRQFGFPISNAVIPASHRATTRHNAVASLARQFVDEAIKRRRLRPVKYAWFVLKPPTDQRHREGHWRRTGRNEYDDQKIIEKCCGLENNAENTQRASFRVQVVRGRARGTGCPTLPSNSIYPMSGSLQ
jgi:hypothetical protein